MKLAPVHSLQGGQICLAFYMALLFLGTFIGIAICRTLGHWLHCSALCCQVLYFMYKILWFFGGPHPVQVLCTEWQK